MAVSIMIVEDDEQLADNLRVFVKRSGWEASVFHSAEAALAAFESEQPNVVLTDHRLPELTGIELIQRLKVLDPQLKIIMITGEGNVRCAVDAMKAGAFDYLDKPVALAELKILIKKAVEAQRTEQTLAYYQKREATDAHLDAMIGDSSPMRQTKVMVRQLLDAESRLEGEGLPSVLITGETGTGKELVARALHFDGRRHGKPFVEVNCAVIPAHLLEAELFGHEKGAFTDAKERRMGLVEAADGGTLFLDEIGEIDLSLQPKLLRLLEDQKVRRLGSVRERKIDLRIISATNRDLRQMVDEGTFRGDLFFRLSIITLTMPPLRERGDDVLALARHFLALHGRRYGKPGLRFSPECEMALRNYDWPGNVRELRNALERAVLLAGGEAVTPDDMQIICGRAPGGRLTSSSTQTAAPDHDGITRGRVNLPEMERDVLLATLAKTDWNVTKSARMLGITRDMLRYRIEKWGLVRAGEAPR